MVAANALLDFDSARSRAAQVEPFPYLIVPGFVRSDAQTGIDADYPLISHPGSFPLASVKYGQNFSDLIDALTGSEMAALVENKLGVDLSDRPTMVTVRGISKAVDGQIHTDSRTKLVTILLYMNQEWETGTGRLRLLRSPDNLQDYIAEVPPDRGTLLMFRNDENAWHGFEPFEGPRRVIQVNWVRDEGVVRRERTRHRFSAFMKRLFGHAKH